MSLPNVPVPAPIRSWMLRKAVWDFLRTRLSYDQANAIKAEAEEIVALVLENVIQREAGK